MASNKIKLVLDLDDKGFVRAISGDVKDVDLLRKKLALTNKAGTSGINKMTGAFGGLSQQLKTLIGVGALSAVAVGISRIAKEAIAAASAAEEIQSKFNTVFRGMSKEMNVWAETFAGDVGRARQDIKEFSAGLADVLKPMGLTTDEAADMSKQMVQLALDVASFNNRQDTDVIHAFKSALTGERESLKTLGIVISEADVKQEAYRAGLVRAGEALTKTAKAQATMNLLFANSKDAQGDLARTMDSYANQKKRLSAETKDLSETLGQIFLPIATDVVTTLAKVTGAIEDNIRQMREFGDVSLTTAMKLQLSSQVAFEFFKKLPKIVGDAASGGVAEAVAKNIGEITGEAAVNFVLKNLDEINKLEEELTKKTKEKADQEERATRAALAAAAAKEKEARALNSITSKTQASRNAAGYRVGMRTPTGGAFGADRLFSDMYSLQKDATGNWFVGLKKVGLKKIKADLNDLAETAKDSDEPLSIFTASFDEFLNRVDIGSDEFKSVLAGLSNTVSGIVSGNPLQTISGVGEILGSLWSTISDGTDHALMAARAQEEYNKKFAEYVDMLQEANFQEIQEEITEKQRAYDDYVRQEYNRMLQAARREDREEEFQERWDAGEFIGMLERSTFFRELQAARERERTFGTGWDKSFQGWMSKTLYIIEGLGLKGEAVYDKFEQMFEKEYPGIDIFDSPEQFMDWYKTVFLPGLAIGKTPFELLLGDLPPGLIPQGFTDEDAMKIIDYLFSISQNTENIGSVGADRIDLQDTFTLSTMNTITIQQANEFIAISRAILNEHQKTNRYLEGLKGGGFLNIGTMQMFANLVTVQTQQAEVSIQRANLNIFGDAGTSRQKISQVENDQYLSVSRA